MGWIFSDKSGFYEVDFFDAFFDKLYGRPLLVGQMKTVMNDPEHPLRTLCEFALP